MNLPERCQMVRRKSVLTWFSDEQKEAERLLSMWRGKNNPQMVHYWQGVSDAMNRATVKFASENPRRKQPK